MKYMTFNSSCSYAGIANLLEDYDINIEDYELIEETRAAYIFKYDSDNDTYVTGPMLQDKKYYDYYLNKKGLELIHKRIDKLDFIDFLKNFKRRCMVGININDIKHAVIFEEYDIARESFIFLNNKRENSSENEYFSFNYEELLDLLNDEVNFCYISYKTGDYTIDLDGEIKGSVDTLGRYSREVLDYIEDERDLDSLEETMDTLFRPFLIDSYTMMDLTDNLELRDLIGKLRNDYLEAIKLKKAVRLIDYISIDDFKKSIEMYKDIIMSEVIID